MRRVTEKKNSRLSDVDRFEGGAAAEDKKNRLDSIVPDDYEEFWEKLKMELSEVDFDSARLTKYAAKSDTVDMMYLSLR